jgi:hypothetical protein
MMGKAQSRHAVDHITAAMSSATETVTGGARESVMGTTENGRGTENGTETGDEAGTGIESGTDTGGGMMTRAERQAETEDGAKAEMGSGPVSGTVMDTAVTIDTGAATMTSTVTVAETKVGPGQMTATAHEFCGPETSGGIGLVATVLSETSAKV